MNTRQLRDLGQSLWLDNITRELLDSGTLKRFIDEWSITGITSNPTIFDEAIGGSAIADGVRETLKRDLDERPTLMEGIDRSEWILLDYFNFVVHVFSRDCRAFYGLERLWGNAERHEISDAAGARP